MGKLSVIVAASQNMVIGKDNKLPWRLPSDVKRFKEITSGHHVIMGRNTWESIPEKFRPLPNRTNWIVSRNKDYFQSNTILVNNIETILNFKDESDDEIFVIGGAEIYKELFPYASKLYLTKILKDIDGNIKLNGFVSDEWNLIKTSETLIENDVPFRYETYIKLEND